MKLTMDRMLKLYVDPGYMTPKKYPKAAKKRRIRNKWRNRFGIPLTEIYADLVLTGGSLFKIVHQHDSFVGGPYHIPDSLIYKTQGD
jgi:hypothetical protein